MLLFKTTVTNFLITPNKIKLVTQLLFIEIQDSFVKLALAKYESL